MPAISFQSVSKTFASARGPFQALDGVTFDIEQGLFVELSRLYERWARWSAQEKAEPLGKRQFGEAISKHGYPSAVRSGVSVSNGISLKPEAETGVGFGAERIT